MSAALYFYLHRAPKLTDKDTIVLADFVNETADSVFKEALERFGRVDTLVNNAGLFMAKPFTMYSNDDYAAYIGTNVSGFFYMTRRAVEAMLKKGGGHIVTISTSLVDQPMTSVPAVLASLTKGALNAATKSLAIECAASGVRVNAVAPSLAMHPFLAKVTTDELLADLTTREAFGRAAEPWEEDALYEIARIEERLHLCEWIRREDRESRGIGARYFGSAYGRRIGWFDFDSAIR